MLTGARTTRFRVAAGCALLSAVLAAGVALAGPATAEPAVPAAGRPAIPATAVPRLASQMSSAWQITSGKGVTVAVLGTAVNRVSDLAGKLTTGPNYAPLPGAPATAGTLLASLIAGSGPTNSNALGAVGRAPGARILAVRVVNASTSPREQQYEAQGVWQGIVGKAIRYAVDHGASVIVDQESGAQDSPALDSAVQYAISKNVVVIGTGYAYGTNLKSTTPAYPDSLPGVINFSGSTLRGIPGPPQQERYAANSSVLVTAPDNQLPATGPGNQPYLAYNELTAAAWVAGTVALIKSVYPQITPGTVANALALSASYHPAGGYNTAIGFGLINPLGALHEAATLTKLGATATPGPRALSAGAELGATPPGAINAVQHPVARLAGSGAAIIIGAVLLLAAVRLRARGRVIRPRHRASSSAS